MIFNCAEPFCLQSCFLEHWLQIGLFLLGLGEAGLSGDAVVLVGRQFIEVQPYFKEISINIYKLTSICQSITVNFVIAFQIRIGHCFIKWHILEMWNIYTRDINVEVMFNNFHKADYATKKWSVTVLLIGQNLYHPIGFTVHMSRDLLKKNIRISYYLLRT